MSDLNTPISAARLTSVTAKSSSASMTAAKTTSHNLSCKNISKRARASNELSTSTPDCYSSADALKQTFAIDSDDALVMGVDEAGRGPVMGPMVYAAAMISLREYDSLLSYCRVADSKTLDECHRNTAFERLHKLKSFSSFIVVISAEEISSTMHGRHNKNLNTLSHEAAIKLISEATLEGVGKLCAAFVDTVGPPESYQNKLTGRFAHLQVMVSKRADSIFPIVSAASIVAKVTRDKFISDLNEHVGSGYPSDPKVTRWLRTHLHRFFVYSRANNFVRLSWAPVVALAKDDSICVPVAFEHDELMNATQRKRYSGSNTMSNYTIDTATAATTTTTTTTTTVTSRKGVEKANIRRCNQLQSKLEPFNQVNCKSNISGLPTLDRTRYGTPSRSSVFEHILHLHSVPQICQENGYIMMYEPIQKLGNLLEQELETE